MPNAVNHPAHYNVGGIEAIEVIDAYELDFNLGNVIKYILRAGRKTDDKLEDLRKAKWYLDHAIKVEDDRFAKHLDTECNRYGR